MRFTIDLQEAGGRLDRVLAARMGVSRGAALRLIDAGACVVNDRPGRKGQSLALGDRVGVENQPDRITAQPDVPLDVLQEGEGWVVIDKPPGTPVHPLRPGEIGTVLNRVVARYPQVQGIGEGGLRSGVVHRLDVATSGCLLVALDPAVSAHARASFAQHGARKTYHALVAGRLEGRAEEAMDLTIARHRPAYVEVVPPNPAGGGGANRAGARRAVRRCTLAWRGVAGGARRSLVEVDLGTGFLHQIRVMLGALGHPVVGDYRYGGPPADRLHLHASSLAIDALGVDASSPHPAAWIQQVQ